MNGQRLGVCGGVGPHSANYTIKNDGPSLTSETRFMVGVLQPLVKCEEGAAKPESGHKRLPYRKDQLADGLAEDR